MTSFKARWSRARLRRSGLRLVPALVCGVSASGTAWGTGTSNEGQAYIDECAAAGVPIPPPFNYEDAFHNRNGTQWVNAGTLADPFISVGLVADVFYYESPQGVCVALPRSTIIPPQVVPENIPLLGVICQGQATSKACFFDQKNIDANQTLQATEFFSGADLLGRSGGVCTNCHRGENVFIMHPLSKLGLNIPKRMPATWVDPIVVDDPSWPQNPGPTTLFDPADRDTCLGCHSLGGGGTFFGGRFPPVSTETSDYCNEILIRSFGRTMPPGETGPLDPANYPPYEDLVAACGEEPAPEFNPAEKMMSFDDASMWSAQSGSLSVVSGNQTEGAGALSVNASGYVRIDSIPFATWNLPVVGTQLALDVFVPPAGQPNRFWLGAVQLYVTVPGTQFINRYLGQLELTPGGTGWRTATFSLPNALRTELLAQHGDVRFGIAVNTPNGAPPVRLDNLRFSGMLVPGPLPPNMGGVRYGFERDADWRGLSGAAVQAAPSPVVAFNSAQSLQIDFNGGGDGAAWTVPVESPPPGNTVLYRVYVPSSVPLAAVSPFIMDANWVWSDTWNPNLPRDTWVTLSVKVPQNAVLPLQQLGLKVYLSAPYSGPVYLDAIQW